MASIVVAGDTSGTVTLAAPAVSGTTTLTLPTTSGTLITTGGGAAGSFTTLTSTQDASFATSSGNVGIGTSSPATKLQVVGTSGSLNARVNAGNTGLDITSNDATGITDLATSPLGAGGKVMTFTTYTGSSSAERMRIDSSGNVQIGKTSNSTLSAGINLGSLPNFIASTASPSDGPYIQISNIASSVANGFRYISFRVGSSGNEAGSISTNGSSTVSYVTSSDYRLKDNIVPMTGALDKVLQLKPCTYTWKSDNSNGQGFIAHELAEIVPDCVTGEKDAVNEDGSIKPQGVDTSFLVATLTAAIQELTARVKELEAKVK